MNPIYGFESLTTEVIERLRKGKNRVGNEVDLLASSGNVTEKLEGVYILLLITIHQTIGMM